MADAYGFTARTADGRGQPLAAYRGCVLLIVNTASRCAFTPQYEGLEALWRRYKDAGLVVLGFPCNQFGHQEPGTDSEIGEFCQASYDVTFPVLAKVEVNGAGADPIYRWLKAEKPGVLGIGAVKWNFTKFLVGRDGHVAGRFAPTVTPASLGRTIEAALAAVPELVAPMADSQR